MADSVECIVDTHLESERDELVGFLQRFDPVTCNRDFLIQLPEGDMFLMIAIGPVKAGIIDNYEATKLINHWGWKHYHSVKEFIKDFVKITFDNKGYTLWSWLKECHKLSTPFIQIDTYEGYPEERIPEDLKDCFDNKMTPQATIFWLA